ncbi:MAG: Rieske 2Fe-2S domain-containing protein [Methanolinea sp.]|jgi:3-phenylpropionate/trans-cinnamate dioxygenase ferredoxin subunit|nr:Rieske 2Fe-2S domain-containing protein [Methanolinea sp.]
MTEYTEVCRLPDIREGELRKVAVRGRDILLARRGDRVYATGVLCPHLRADLSEGTLQGYILTCPLHGSRFDIRDGHVVRWTNLSGTILEYASRAIPPRPLPCFPVRIDGDRVLVGVPWS